MSSSQINVGAIIVCLTFLLIALGVLLWIRIKTRNPEIQCSPEPIFPQPVQKNSSDLFRSELQDRLSRMGLIDAGIQRRKVSLKNGQTLILYTSTDPVDGFLSAYEHEKSVTITGWLKFLGNQDQEVGRIRIQMQRRAARDIVTGELHQNADLELLSYELNSGEETLSNQLVDILLEFVENLAVEFQISEIKGPLIEQWRAGFQRYKYSFDEDSLKSIQVRKFVSSQNPPG